MRRETGGIAATAAATPQPPPPPGKGLGTGQCPFRHWLRDAKTHSAHARPQPGMGTVKNYLHATLHAILPGGWVDLILIAQVQGCILLAGR
jgi:hypothetical protein